MTYGCLIYERITMGIFDGLDIKKEKNKKWRVFYCFDGRDDHWRVYSLASQLTSITGQKIFTPQEWQAVMTKGEDVVKGWFDKNIDIASCLIVLIGSKTAERDLVLYQIEKAWRANKGVFGVHIHNCDDVAHKPTIKGRNPFELINIDGKQLSDITSVYEPPSRNSQEVYEYIKQYIHGWVTDAIMDRELYN